MTLEELAQILGKSEITLISSFKRTQENLKKKGILKKLVYRILRKSILKS